MLCDQCKCQIDTRTTKQNSSLHLYFQLLSDALNESGYDMKSVIRKEVDIPWTPVTVKEFLWRPIQKMYNLEASTTKLKTKDVDKIYDTVNRVVGERTGVYVEFPSQENLLIK